MRQPAQITGWTLAALGFLAGATLGSPGPFQDPPPAPSPPEREAPDAIQDDESGATLEERFEALEAELEEAMDAFMQAYYEATEKGESVDFDKYPLVTMAPRFVALADEGSIGAIVWVLENQGMGLEVDAPAYLAKALGRDNEADLTAVLLMLHYSFSLQNGDGEQARAVIGQLDAYSARDEARFALEARIGSARLMATAAESDKESRASAVARYEALLEDDAASEHHAQLKGELFVMTRLQVGMVAPEIDAADVDGEGVRLSDYRGKVTVLEFWGFW